MIEKYKHIFAAFFLVILLGFSGYNFFVLRTEIIEDVTQLEKPEGVEEWKAYMTSIDSVLTANLVFGHSWNEWYAQILNVFGKNEENSFKYVRDKDGVLYTGDFWNVPDISAEEITTRIRRLQDRTAPYGTKVVVLLFPPQYNEAWSDGYYGIPYRDYSEYTEEVLAQLRYYNIDYLEYREYFEKDGVEVLDLFYKTDHHWRTEVAFEGFQILVDYLNQNYDEKLDLYYTDINNYEVEKYEDAFIGSRGREAGLSYVGMDDYQLIIPKFDMQYALTSHDKDGNEMYAKGDTMSTLISRKYFAEEHYYDKDLYGSYLDGIRYDDAIETLDNPDGLDVLFLRDSFASPMATFFAPYCSEMRLLWTERMGADRVEKVIEEKAYDYIFVAISVDNLTGVAVPYYATEEAEQDGQS